MHIGTAGSAMGLSGIPMRSTLNQVFALAVLLLAGTSLAFTVEVIRFKRGLKGTGQARVLQSGARAAVLQVVDGDEVSVRLPEGPLTVRLLGIAAFDPSIQDPVAQPFGKAAVQHLEKVLGGREVSLVFDELKFDARKRLLAYVHIGTADVGEGLVSRGLALAYTRYAFSRMPAYLQAEDGARRHGEGLWADPVVSARAVQLRVVWDQERAKED